MKDERLTAGGTAEGRATFRRPPALLAFLALGLSFLILAGCRREDVREFTVEIPSLTEATKPKVVEALRKYQGVRQDSFRWDFAKRTLTLRYDSMQVARTNIRMAIAAKGLEVVFPTNTTGRAGY